MSEPFTVLFADDQAATRAEPFKAALRRAVRSQAPSADLRLVALDSEARVLKLLEAKGPLHAAFLDILWHSRGGEGPVSSDRAKELLAASLKRAETVTVLTSREADRLIEYMYSTFYERLHPHAVVSLSNQTSSNVLEGVLASAFSAACMPLRSFGVDVKWNYSFVPQRQTEGINKIAAAELGCLALSGTPETVTVTPIGGGLSGSLTAFVESYTAAPKRGQGPDSLLLKLDTNRSRLETELEAHERLVPSWPANVFAPLWLKSSLSFAGLHALAFRQASGQTVNALGENFLSSGGWSTIFSATLVQHLVRRSRIESTSDLDLHLNSQLGLTPARFESFKGALSELRLPSEEAEYLRQPAEQLLSRRPRHTGTTVIHGDLHTRNVLMDKGGQVFLVDAASMRDKGPYLEDVARLGVWLAAELASGGDSGAQHLNEALGLTEYRQDGPMWVRVLATSISQTMETFSSEWEGRAENPKIDVQADWRLCVASELMRATYSRDTFGPVTREATASAAFVALQQIRPRKEESVGRP